MNAKTPNPVEKLERQAQSGSIADIMSKDSDVGRFAQMAKAHLEKINKTNVITLAQFEPYMGLFKVDKDRFENEETYRRQLGDLFLRYRTRLGINIYEPTIVIRSETDRTEVYFLDRLLTRIQSDIVDGKSNRESIPQQPNRAAGETQAQKFLDASLQDVMQANSTPEQRSFFMNSKIQSAFIQKKFVEKNLSPEARAEVMAGLPDGVDATSSTPKSKPSRAVILDD